MKREDINTNFHIIGSLILILEDQQWIGLTGKGPGPLNKWSGFNLALVYGKYIWLGGENPLYMPHMFPDRD
jgi:hypothetical protein